MSAYLFELSCVGFLIYSKKSYYIETIPNTLFNEICPSYLSPLPLAAAAAGRAQLYSDKFSLVPIAEERFAICEVWLRLTREGARCGALWQTHMNCLVLSCLLAFVYKYTRIERP